MENVFFCKSVRTILLFRVAKELGMSAIAVMDTLRTQNTLQKPQSPTSSIGHHPVTAMKSLPSALTNHSTANASSTSEHTTTADPLMTNGLNNNDDFQKSNLPTVLPSPPPLAARKTKVR